MNTGYDILRPFNFNPLKHHLSFIREFTMKAEQELDENGIKPFTTSMSHIGNSVMDIYSGLLSHEDICNEIYTYLDSYNLTIRKEFSLWAGTKHDDFRIAVLSDTSHWVMKYHNNNDRYIHIFPSRDGSHSFRVKANTLKTAILYNVIIGKDFITVSDLNKARTYLNLSPVKSTTEVDAIIEMIEILRL